MKINLTIDEIQALDHLCYTLDDIAAQRGAFDFTDYDNGIVKTDPEYGIIEIHEEYIPAIADFINRICMNGKVQQFIESAKNLFNFIDEEASSARNKVKELLHHAVAEYKVYVYDDDTKFITRSQNNAEAVIAVFNAENRRADRADDFEIIGNPKHHSYWCREYHTEYNRFADIESVDRTIIRRVMKELEDFPQYFKFDKKR